MWLRVRSWRDAAPPCAALTCPALPASPQLAGRAGQRHGAQPRRRCVPVAPGRLQQPSAAAWQQAAAAGTACCHLRVSPPSFRGGCFPHCICLPVGRRPTCRRASEFLPARGCRRRRAPSRPFGRGSAPLAYPFWPPAVVLVPPTAARVPPLRTATRPGDRSPLYPLLNPPYPSCGSAGGPPPTCLSVSTLQERSVAGKAVCMRAALRWRGRPAAPSEPAAVAAVGDGDGAAAACTASSSGGAGYIFFSWIFCGTEGCSLPCCRPSGGERQ